MIFTNHWKELDNTSNSKMKAMNQDRLFVTLVLLAGVGLLAALHTAQANDSQSGGGQLSAPIWSRINRKLSPLFDFPEYKRSFNKTYAGLREELNRARLFFARAFKVFIARIKYMYGSSNKYLAINEMSDWTPAERASMYGLDASGGAGFGGRAQNIPATDLATVEKKLAEIVQRKDESIGFKQIADQLEAKQEQQQSQRRRKRNAAAQRPIRELPEEKLIHDPSRIVQGQRGHPADGPTGQGGEISELERQQIEGESLKAASLDEIVDSLSSVSESPAAAAAAGSTPGAPEVAGDESSRDRVLLDYRESGCVGPVKMQHRCGACYIFATLELYEYQYCLKSGEHARFSEQYIIDCGLQKGLKGCTGGGTEQVASFIERFGLELNDYYGYKATHRACPYNLDAERELAGRVRVTPWTEFRSFTKFLASNEKIESFLESKGPMVIAVSPNEEFADYGGGVDWLQGGGGGGESGRGHAMVLIGHGIEDGVEYWLIKNSHGLGWGEMGYYKLDKRVDAISAYRFDHLKAEFVENSQHSVERVRQKISENLPLHEKMFAWTGLYST